MNGDFFNGLLVPSMAAWGLELVRVTATHAGIPLGTIAGRFGNNLFFDGMVSLSQGFLLTSMLLSALLVFVIGKDFRKGGATMIVLALCSSIGLIHAYRLTERGIENHCGLLAAPEFAMAYALGVLFLFGLHVWQRGWRWK